ncbi:MAG: bifunctional 23S rRNA (guanine(2069)-N(7))-methyltransferase RlmK/23S rRNA (guanine(2445)-N(2))-methyltransferase RlmL [Atopobiaceae bacterium]|nr:bifunctional 23S rRNA (guanine(2069)-N(7))-methyltransferase RlmK/23S rRNA (guanine(2445)-N(2))-methyltransferase RlmL [Atopobiaceae bacterium]
MEFFATCPAGFERLLADELVETGIERPRPLRGQVAFFGELEDAYRACLWSRLASRVVLVLGRHDARNSDELYAGAQTIAWEEHLFRDATFAVDASGTNAQLRTTQFVAVRVKDAVVDRLLAKSGVRPQVDAHNPHVRIVARISKDHAVFGIDLAGEPLFHRTYLRRRDKASMRALRADYAAALLIQGGWDKAAQQDGASLLAVSNNPDPLVLEAAHIAARRAPGLSRTTWGFSRWAGHDHDAWQNVVAEAQAAVRADVPASIAYLSWRKGVSQARGTLQTLGLDVDLRAVSEQSAADLGDVALMACDLADVQSDELVREASLLTSVSGLVHAAAPRTLAMAARDKLASAYVRHDPAQTLVSMLGKDELLLLSYDTASPSREQAFVTLADGIQAPVLVPASDQFAARLRKNARLRAKWAKREDVTCYRVYDADLPDYAVSIELYRGTNPATGEPTNRSWLQIFEYAAPKGIDPLLARSRLMDVLSLAPQILGVDPHDTFVRVRRRDKGGSQYAAEASEVRARPVSKGHVPLPPGAHLIDEGGLVFEVNFSTRLDCGIFLDHRDTRAMLREMAKQTKGSKRFLNLFAYTGTATCYAADGGMRYTTTVDLSKPSLDWARRNMARNGFEGKEHEFVQADVVRWISEQRRTKNRWDLVFCDVPTFSNSNRMGKRSFDVQRDHAELLIGVSRLLVRGGVCVFSCNLRSFAPDVEALRKAGVTIEDITDKTIPEDFARNKRIHHAYLVRRAPQTN